MSGAKPTAMSGSGIGVASILGSTVRMTEGAEPTSSAVGELRRGQVVEVLETDGLRARISANGGEDERWVRGWVDAVEPGGGEALLSAAGPAREEERDVHAAVSSGPREGIGSGDQGAVRICLLSGEDLGLFEVRSGETVRQLKQRLELQTGIPVKQQRLVLGASTLDDATALRSVLSGDGQALQLVRSQGQRAPVALRCRPLSRREVEAGERRAVFLDAAAATAAIRGEGAGGGAEDEEVALDAVFDEGTPQQYVFDVVAADLVERALEGYSAAIFAYGPTGTGKSHTMRGPASDGETQGLLPRSIQHLFACMRRTACARFLVSASYAELYDREFTDLLRDFTRRDGPRCRVRENHKLGPWLDGVSQVTVGSAEALLELLEVGQRNFMLACTAMERDSSASNLLFSLTVTSACDGRDGEARAIRRGRLHFVELAGSERQQLPHERERSWRHKSQALFANVVRAVGEGARFVPYRDAPIAHLLKDFLGGKSSLAVVATCSPAGGPDLADTRETLRMARLFQRVENHPKACELGEDSLASLEGEPWIQGGVGGAPAAEGEGAGEPP